MPQAKVTMQARAVNARVSIIDIEGEVTSTAEQTLMDVYGAATDAGARVILLNFAGMEYMNSSGIGLLVTLLIRINRQKQRLLTFGLSEHYRNIFELTRLDDAIGIYATERDALAAANAI